MCKINRYEKDIKLFWDASSPFSFMKSSRPNSEYPNYTYSKNKHIFKKKKKPINNYGKYLWQNSHGIEQLLVS